MKRASSVLVMSLFVSAALPAQNAATPFRPTPADSLRTTFVVRAQGDSVRRSHAVRNGAIAGAVVGAVSGGSAASLLNFGCKTPLPAPPCHADRDAAIAITAGTVLGGLALGLVGAGLGKMWQWLR
ncbi:MAG TPA: hypothetical protein VIP11_17125 [Gemmatimonadaceae bacterium]